MLAEFEPVYLKLHQTGALKKRARKLYELMHDCVFCPRLCRVNRFAGAIGICQAPAELRVSSYNPHFGEARPLVGDVSHQ